MKIACNISVFYLCSASMLCSGLRCGLCRLYGVFELKYYLVYDRYYTHRAVPIFIFEQFIFAILYVEV